MRFPDGLGPAGFLAGCWQKSPLFLPAAIDSTLPALTPDELAWLATLPDVESRLIHTRQDGANTRYRVEHGPFDDDTLMQLPDSNWTLLVQDVEKHLPDFRAWLDQVRFVPDWRIDDLMVSCAAPGGSVGPHQDQYDVFLCQGPGQRDWRLASPDNVEASVANMELSLLEPFIAEQTVLAQSSDVLYLPPGVPHWGIARDRCVTYSIGMRAPQFSEFIAAFERLFPGRSTVTVSTEALAVFYEDPDLLPDEALPGLISERAIHRAQARFAHPACRNGEEFTAAFGSLVTDPKAWLAPDRMAVKAARRVLKGLHAESGLQMHGMARVAYTTGGAAACQRAQLFANGFHRFVDADFVGHVTELCRRRGLDCRQLGDWRKNPRQRELLEWLLTRGVFDAGDQ